MGYDGQRTVRLHVWMDTKIETSTTYRELRDNGRRRRRRSRGERDVVRNRPGQPHGNDVRVRGVRGGAAHYVQVVGVLQGDGCWLIFGVEIASRAGGNAAAPTRRGGWLVFVVRVLGRAEVGGAEQRVRLVPVHGVFRRVRPWRVRVRVD